MSATSLIGWSSGDLLWDQVTYSSHFKGLFDNRARNLRSDNQWKESLLFYNPRTEDGQLVFSRDWHLVSDSSRGYQNKSNFSLPPSQLPSLLSLPEEAPCLGSRILVSECLEASKQANMVTVLFCPLPQGWGRPRKEIRWLGISSSLTPLSTPLLKTHILPNRFPRPQFIPKFSQSSGS